MTEDQIKHMVDRFLGWKLPVTFNPDGGISFDPVMNKGHAFERRRELYGTNLFDADQATAMVRYMVERLLEDAAVGGSGAAMDRIRSHAVTALECTRSARTQSDVRRYIQRVIDGIDVEIALKGGAGRLPDRETFWLIERNVTPPQYVSQNSAGWHHDVWVARRFVTEREAHDYWRLMGEQDRPQFKVVEHMFINRQ